MLTRLLERVGSDALLTRWWRLRFRLFPAYRGTGGRVIHLEPDWSELVVEIPHSWRTRNYVGTIFGGSIYGAVDPIYMLMLIQRLDDDYTVWDRSARIEFEKPGREDLYAAFSLDDEELAAVKDAVADGGSTEREYEIEVVNADGERHATVEKTVYVRRDA